ncbi:Uncharacterised protein [Yersinia enterocolitica]|nr:Uncharacterised protein [Yersinia enterocolitica]
MLVSVKQADRKDAVNPSLARTLYSSTLPSPYNIESSRFVSSLNLIIVILVKKPIELVSGSEI